MLPPRPPAAEAQTFPVEPPGPALTPPAPPTSLSHAHRPRPPRQRPPIGVPTSLAPPTSLSHTPCRAPPRHRPPIGSPLPTSHAHSTRPRPLAAPYAVLPSHWISDPQATPTQATPSRNLSPIGSTFPVATPTWLNHARGHAPTLCHAHIKPRPRQRPSPRRRLIGSDPPVAPPTADSPSNWLTVTQATPASTNHAPFGHAHRHPTSLLAAPPSTLFRSHAHKPPFSHSHSAKLRPRPPPPPDTPTASTPFYWSTQLFKPRPLP